MVPALVPLLLLVSLFPLSTFAQDAQTLRARIGQRVLYMQNPCFIGREYNGTMICVPAVWLAGIGKSGTSALYHFLRFHAQISAPLQKEVCAHENEDDLAYLYRISSMQLRPLKPSQVIINGCIRSYDPQMRRIADAFPEMKIIYMFRQYPTWLYSTFWFWCMPGWDYNCTGNGQWLQPYHYRSRELFHDLVLAGTKIHNNPVYPYTLMNYVGEWRAGVNQWGQKRMLALTAEALHDRGEESVKRVMSWIGVGVPKRLMWLQYNQTINANQNKGVREVSPRDAALGGSYPPMLNETRDVLNRLWYQECLEMNKIALLDWVCVLPSNQTAPPTVLLTPPPPPCMCFESAIETLVGFFPLALSLVVAFLLLFRFGGRLWAMRLRLRRREYSPPLPLRGDASRSN